MAEREFDLTLFSSAESFKKLLARHKLSSGYKRRELYKNKPPIPEMAPYYEYMWSNKEGTIATYNNPITGAYTTPKTRKNEKGYASYVTVTGTAKFVKKVSGDIMRTATYVKGEKNDSW